MVAAAWGWVSRATLFCVTCRGCKCNTACSIAKARASPPCVSCVIRTLSEQGCLLVCLMRSLRWSSCRRRRQTPQPTYTPTTRDNPIPCSNPDGFLAAAGVEGGVLVVRVQSADRAPEDVHLPAAGDRPGYHPYPVRHYLEEHSRGDGSRSGALNSCLRKSRWKGMHASEANDFEDTYCSCFGWSCLLPRCKGGMALARFWAF